MSHGYALSTRKARICRVAGAAFLLCAVLTTSHIPIAATAPELRTACADLGCKVDSPLTVLPSKVQAEVAASPAARQAFDGFLRRPLVRLGLAGIAALKTLPFALLLLGVGVALRRLGERGGDPLARALPWLRRASIAAIVGALASPLHDSLLEMLLYRGTPAGAYWSLVLNFQDIGLALMLAAAAYATIWALEAGLHAQRELAEIV